MDQIWIPITDPLFSNGLDTYFVLTDQIVNGFTRLLSDPHELPPLPIAITKFSLMQKKKKLQMHYRLRFNFIIAVK